MSIGFFGKVQNRLTQVGHVLNGHRQCMNQPPAHSMSTTFPDDNAEERFRIVATTGSLDRLQTVLRHDLYGSRCGDMANMITVMLPTKVPYFIGESFFLGDRIVNGPKHKMVSVLVRTTFAQQYVIGRSIATDASDVLIIRLVTKVVSTILFF